MDISAVTSLRQNFRAIQNISADSNKPADMHNIEDKAEIGSLSEDVSDLIRLSVGADGKAEDFTVVRGTSGSDIINISCGKDGGLDISVNGKTSSYTSEQTAKMIIDAGPGDDRITADKDVTARLLITGGEGFDYIQAGSGDDVIADNYGQTYIDAGSGNDVIIANGKDLKDPYGLSLVHGRTINGNIINCGDGHDYAEGSSFNDAVFGFEGNDVIHGFGGDDVLLAGTGKDTVYGNEGSDYIEAQGAGAKIFGGQGDDNIDAWEHASIISDTEGRNTIKAEKGADTLMASPDSTVSTDEKTNVIRLSGPMFQDFNII